MVSSPRYSSHLATKNSSPKTENGFSRLPSSTASSFHLFRKPQMPHLLRILHEMPETVLRRERILRLSPFSNGTLAAIRANSPQASALAKHEVDFPDHRINPDALVISTEPNYAKRLLKEALYGRAELPSRSLNFDWDRRMPREKFKREVEKELTGKDSEPSELIYFRVYKSQIPIIERAIETAGLMLGSDKARGYCLEMICADFLAGASIEGNEPEVLLQSLSRYFRMMPAPQRGNFLAEINRAS